MIPNKVYDILINLLPMIILFCVVMILVKIVSIIYKKEKLIVYKEIKNLIYLVYCFALFQLVTTTDFISYSNNFVPFQEIMRYKLTSPLFYRNIIGNIALFIPFGFIISDMIKEKVGKTNLLITSFICLFTSTTIEIIQMFIGRSFDIDDIILNFVGSILGYIVYKIIHVLYNKFPNKMQNDNYKLAVLVILILLFFTIFLIYFGVTR